MTSSMKAETASKLKFYENVIFKYFYFVNDLLANTGSFISRLEPGEVRPLVPQLEEVDDDVALWAAPHPGVGGQKDAHQSRA